jgi:uncharacterized protein (TIGR03382 family)
VNIRDAASDAILATPFKTGAASPLALAGMTPFQVDLSAFSAQTVRLDFEHQVNQFHFLIVWDNIRVICKGISASPGTLAFGTVDIGTASPAQTTTITNFAATTLTITSIPVTGPFVVTSAPALPISLAPGGSTAVSISFHPVAVGAVAGSLTLNSDDPNGATVVALTGTGNSAPVLTTSPAAVAFGNVQVGQVSGAQAVTLSNTGTTALTISSASTAAPFAVSAPTLPITLAPGTSTSVSVTFAPGAPGPASGSLSIVSNDPSSPTAIPLSGTGVAPQLATNPTSVDFGDQRVATTGTRAVVVSNPGSATLTITAITAGGVFANTDSVPISIAPGGSATLAVRFTPTSATTFTGNLTITSNAAQATTVVPLTGRGVEPLVSINPGSLAFGNGRVGTTSPTKPITVTNTGSAALTVGSVSVAAPFIASAAAPITLAPGASTEIQVAFAPTVAGPASATVVITSDAASSPTAIAVTGTGVEPVISASTTSLDFGNVREGTTSAGKTVTLKNVGTSPLAITAASAPAQFTITPPATLPLSVLPGASATFTVKFAPTALGPASGTVVITSDAASSPTQIAVTGVAVQPQLVVAPSAHDFGDVRVGATTAATTVTVTNPGTDTLSVTSIATAAPFALAAPVTLPAQIAPGGSLTFGVVFAPTARATAAGAVTIASDAGSGSVALAGRGVAPLIAASLDPVDFGTVAINATESLALQLSNPGDAPLTIGTLAFAGASAGDFAFTTQPALPAVVAPGGALTVSIDFTPSDHGARAATLTATSDALGTAALAVDLAGSGSGARVELSPTALDFGTSNVTVTTPPRTVAISNTGETDLVVSSIVLGGANAGDFAVTATLPLTIAAGASADLAVTFTPSAVGGRSATATVLTTDPLAPTSAITLAGTGESPVIAVTPAILAFGEVRTGQTRTLPVTIANTGTGPLTIAAFDLSGPDAAQLAIEPITVPLVLAPAATRVVNVTFSPTVLGTAQAVVTVLSDDPLAASVAVPITGTGVSPTVTISPSDLDFGGQLVGRLSAPRQVHLQNTGTGPLILQSFAVTGVQAASFSVASAPSLPATIAAGGELVLSLQLTPPALGAQAATLELVTDSPDAPNATVTLAGLGISSALAVTPSTIDFGTTHVPAQTTPVAVTLTNLSSDPLVVVDATLGGARPGDFTVSSVAGSLAPGASVTAMVSYTAAAAATSAATVTFRTTDSAVPQAIVTVSGKAVSAFLTVDHTSLEFGKIQVGDRSGPRSVTVTNTTTTAITIASVTGADDQFVIDATAATAPIAPGASASFTVVFAPADAAPAASQIQVMLQGATTPELTIAVTGEGTAGGGGGGCATTGGSSSLVVGVLALLLALRRRR